MKIYKNQTKLTIKITITGDLTGYLTAKIKYVKPNGSTGEWTAMVTDQVLSYSVVDVNDIDVAGNWVIYPYVTYSDGKTITGTPSDIKVYNGGK